MVEAQLTEASAAFGSFQKVTHWGRFYKSSKKYWHMKNYEHGHFFKEQNNNDENNNNINNNNNNNNGNDDSNRRDYLQMNAYH